MNWYYLLDILVMPLIFVSISLATGACDVIIFLGHYTSLLYILADRYIHRPPHNKPPAFIIITYLLFIITNRMKVLLANSSIIQSTLNTLFTITNYLIIR